MTQEAFEHPPSIPKMNYKSNRKQLSAEVDQLRHEVQDIRKDLHSMTEILSQMNQNQIQVMEQSNALQQNDSSETDATQEVIDSAEQQIKKRPFLSFATAVGVGALVTRFTLLPKLMAAYRFVTVTKFASKMLR